MQWEETRGTSRAPVDAARRVAHADDAKSRDDEASRLSRRVGLPAAPPSGPGRSRPKRVWVLAGAGLLVVIGAVTAAALAGGDPEPPAEVRAVAADPSPTQAVEAEEPTPAEELSESQPSGEWRVQILGREMTQRDGATKPFKDTGDPVVWTIPTGTCTDTGCSGTITSSSGREFPFAWNGTRLGVELAEERDRRPKEACIDDVTREPLPIQESAVIITYTPKFRAFTGDGSRMTMTQTLRVAYEWFGTCDAAPADPVAYTYEWVMKARS